MVRYSTRSDQNITILWRQTKNLVKFERFISQGEYFTAHEETFKTDDKVNDHGSLNTRCL